MAGSLVLSSASAGLILAVAQMQAKDAIRGNIVRSLRVRDLRRNAMSSSRSTASTTDVSTGADTTSPDRNVFAVLYRLWFRLPEVARFFVAGNLGNAGFFYLERQINNIISLCPVEMVPPFVLKYQDGVSFFVGYLLQIVSTHLLLAVLVYGVDTINSVEKYCKTLSGQFYAYAFSLVGSTILSTYLQQRGVEKNTAIVVTMLIFACVNYFLIGWIVKRAVASATVHSKEKKFLLNNKDSVPAVGKAVRNNNARPKTKERRLRTPNPTKKPSGRGFADLMGKVQRGGAFILGCKTHHENHPIWLEQVPRPSLQEYVEQTGNPPTTVEKVNQNRQEFMRSTSSWLVETHFNSQF